MPEIVLADRALTSMQTNPLGHEVTLLSAVMLNLGQLMGSGIYSVSSSVLTCVGSVGLFLMFWLISASFAFGECNIHTFRTSQRLK